MKIYNLILLTIATLSFAADETGTVLTTLATVEVEAPAPTAEAPADTAATTDAPNATDTAEPETGAFETDDNEGGSEAGTVVGGNEETGVEVTKPEDLPDVFQNKDADATNIDASDPPEDSSNANSSAVVRRDAEGNLEARWGGGTKWCWGPYNVWSLRFAMTCPYYSRNFARSRFGKYQRWGKKLHADLRVWSRRGRNWRRPSWRLLTNLQVARYTHKGKQCGFIYDKVSSRVLYDRCMYWTWPQMAGKLTRVCLRVVRKIMYSAHWPTWAVNHVIGGMWWLVKDVIMKLKWY